MSAQQVKMPTRDEQWSRTLRLEKRRFVSEYLISEVAFQLKETIGHAEHLRAVKLRVEGYIYAEMDRRIKFDIPGCDVRYPRTWWDAFKVRWFPAWAIKRWPASFDGVTLKPFTIDEPVYKACYVNLPQCSDGYGMTLFEVVKPEHQRERGYR